MREVEEEINKFLSSHPVRILHMAQSETGDHISVTLLFEDAESDHIARRHEFPEAQGPAR